MKLPYKKVVAKSPQGREVIQLPAENIYLLHNLKWYDTWDVFDDEHDMIEHLIDPLTGVELGIADRFAHHPDDGLDNNGW